MGKDENNQHQNWLLIGWIIVILASVLTIIIAFPFMRRAYHQSQVGSLMQQYRESQENLTSEAAQTTVYFLVPDRLAQPKLEPFVVPAYSTSYHAAIEALLAGPSVEALRVGGISYIPPDTRLIGLTVSYEIAYINLSEAFLTPTIGEPEGYTWRTAQIMQTLVRYPGIRDVIILVEGKILQQEAQ